MAAQEVGLAGAVKKAGELREELAAESIIVSWKTAHGITQVVVDEDGWQVTQVVVDEDGWQVFVDQVPVPGAVG